MVIVLVTGDDQLTDQFSSGHSETGITFISAVLSLFQSTQDAYDENSLDILNHIPRSCQKKNAREKQVPPGLL